MVFVITLRTTHRFNVEIGLQFSGSLELQDQGHAVTGFQRCFQSREHEVCTARFELEGPVCRNVITCDRAHMADISIAHGYMSLDFLSSGRFTTDQSVGHRRVVVERHVTDAYRHAWWCGA